LIIGTVFTLGIQHWNEPIKIQDAMRVEATFDSYNERFKIGTGRSRGIIVYFSDYEQLNISVSCITDELREDLKNLSKGEKLVLLVHPNSSTIWEICSEEKTLMSFEHAQKNLQEDNIGFGILGIFMYFCAAVGIYYLIMGRIRAKKLKRFAAERRAKKKSDL
jgi:hypothetical protein